MTTSDGYVRTRKMLAACYPHTFSPPGSRKYALHPRIFEKLEESGRLTRQEINGFLAEYQSGASYYKAILRDDVYRDLGGRTTVAIEDGARERAREMIAMYDQMEARKDAALPNEATLHFKKIYGAFMLEARGPQGELLMTMSLGPIQRKFDRDGFRFDPERNAFVRP